MILSDGMLDMIVIDVGEQGMAIVQEVFLGSAKNGGASSYVS